MGNKGIFSGEQGNKSLELRETGEHTQFWETENIENQDFVFGEQGDKAIFFEGTRDRYPIWEGLTRPTSKGTFAGIFNLNVIISTFFIPFTSKRILINTRYFIKVRRKVFD